jgi:hypothetical protein
MVVVTQEPPFPCFRAHKHRSNVNGSGAVATDGRRKLGQSLGRSASPSLCALSSMREVHLWPVCGLFKSVFARIEVAPPRSDPIILLSKLSRNMLDLQK